MRIRNLLQAILLPVTGLLVLPCCLFAQPTGQGLSDLLAYCSKWKSIPNDSLAKYSRIAVKLAGESNDHAATAEAYLYLGLYYRQSSLFDSAFYAFDLVDAHAQKSHKPAPAKNTADLVRGTLLIQTNKHKEAISWYYTLLERPENAPNTVNQLSILNGIGWANMELERFDDALRWFRRVVTNPAYQADPLIIYTYNNLAATFGAVNQLDSCEYYLKQALLITEKHHLLTSKANTLNIYADMLIAQQRYAEAEQKILASMEIRKEISDPFYIVSDMAQLAGLYALQKAYHKGISLAEEALALAKQHQMEAKYPMIYQSLFDNYYGAGDFRKSADLMQELVRMKDTINNKASAKALAEMEVKYETAKKEQQILQQQFELTKKNYWIRGGIVLLILLSALFYYIYTSVKQKQRQIMQQAIIREQDQAARAVISAEENERHRMSQTLHDGVGTTLSALKMNLQGLEPAVIAAPELGNVYRNALSLSEDAIRDIRSVSHQLVPNNVMRMGLANALRSLIEKINHNGLQTDFHFQGDLHTIPQDVQLIIYRILQESINNVIRHSGASKLSVALECGNQQLRAVVRDNGQGFDAKGSDENWGIGLGNIATRIRFLKGNYQIESAPDTGTAIIFNIPVNQPEEKPGT